MSTNVPAEAEKMHDHFRSMKRDNGEGFYVLDDTREDWMQDVAHEAHGDFMPDDWRYEFIEDALDILRQWDEDADEDSLREASSELRTYIYNADMLRWLASNLNRIGYTDEALEETGHGESIMDEIGAGMLSEQVEVFDAVLDALLQRVDAD